MKRKLVIVAVFAAALLVLAGCSDYSDIEDRLDRVTIENKLPKLSNRSYRTMEDAEDAVYDQQMAACEMLADSYAKTNPKNLYENFKGNDKRILEKCNNKRNDIDKDIKSLYMKNLGEIMEDVRDCPNVNAYVSKTYSNVLTFYDELDHYQNADDKDQALTDILVYYYDRTNVLAKSFLARNEEEVFDSSVSVIEENAKAEDSFRFYINKNNIIIKALNEIYGGVPAEYADKINEAGNILARNLLESLESLTDRERANLMDELGLSTPSPTPKASPTPGPSATPAPTGSPTPVPTPTPTPRAAVTPTPAPRITVTPTPVPAPAVTPTSVPQQRQETAEQQAPVYTEEPPAVYDFD